ncbi:MAG: polysaccharide deacetylase family protein [Anaerolineae bacterium]|nr:MAG: polysaccharide deacetylase family protein [Anaerolineae bacterium]
MTSFSLSRRDFLKLGLTAVASLVTPPLRLKNDPAGPEEIPVFEHGSPLRPYVALTYDDCYLVTILHELEDILAEHPEVKITLFPVGWALLNNERKDPGIWKRFYEKGHEFGYHSFNHIGATVMSTKALIEDYDRWYDALTQVLGEEAPVRFARPTYGLVSRSLANMCEEKGLTIVMWSRGWGGPYENAARAIRETQPGDVVLMHTRSDDMFNTRKGLEVNAGRGLEFTTLSTLYTGWLLDTSGLSHGPPGPPAPIPIEPPPIPPPMR